MRLTLYILFLVTQTIVFGQQPPAPTKRVDIMTQDTKKVKFADIEIESDGNQQFKTLEIRYLKFEDHTIDEIEVEGKKYKSFPDKKSAVSYYSLIKKKAPEYVIYYVYSVEPRKPEVFTFRSEE